MSKLMTIDLGSFNIKLSNGGIYENRFLLDNEGEIFGQDTIEYEGNTYFFGRGQFDRTYAKMDKNIEVPLLFGLGKEGVSGNINSILHLPANQMNMKDQLKDRLQGKTFHFKINGNGRSITFDTVGILKEGFSSFYSLAKRNEGLICIIDIGGRTIDIFTFIDGKLEKEDSIPIGTMNYFSDIADTLIGRGRLTVLEDIHTLLKHNVIDLKDFEDVTAKVSKEILNAIKIKFPNINEYDIKLCGGGAEYFKDSFKKEFRKVSVLNNNLTSNVDGAEKIGKAKGLDK